MSDFDKNIKIPEIKINTGKITAAVTKANEVMSDFLNNNPFSEFDRIANDIRDRVDNAIAMEFTKYIGELLRKNGVVPKITEYTRDFETDNTFETRYGVSIEELDFSEHDKVFEDKIAELKKDYKTASELLGKYQQENESLKKRIIELENFSCQAEQETESLVEKLKQRIAELENENKNLNIRLFQNEAYGDKKLQKINLNDRIKVKLTPLGAEIHYHQYDELNKKIKENVGTQLEPRMPEIDKDGFTEFTLWHFMELYGEHIGMCKPNVIEPLNIVVAE